MKTRFRKSFARDLRKIKDRELRERIAAAIEQVEEAQAPAEIGDLKKMAGEGSYFRIRVGEYRIGVEIEGDTVEFVRCLSRRDLYKHFP